MSTQPTPPSDDFDTHPCPFCGEPPQCCDHQFIEVEWSNHDLAGTDPDMLLETSERLTKALWNAVKTKGLADTSRHGAWSGPLAELLAEEDFDSGFSEDDVDSCDWGGLVYDYLLAVAASLPDVERHEWEWYSNGIGSSSCVAVYAKDGEAAFRAMMKVVRSDIAGLKAFVK